MDVCALKHDSQNNHLCKNLTLNVGNLCDPVRCRKMYTSCKNCQWWKQDFIRTRSQNSCRNIMQNLYKTLLVIVISFNFYFFYFFFFIKSENSLSPLRPQMDLLWNYPTKFPPRELNSEFLEAWRFLNFVLLF